MTYRQEDKQSSIPQGGVRSRRHPEEYRSGVKDVEDIMEQRKEKAGGKVFGVSCNIQAVGHYVSFFDKNGRRASMPKDEMCLISTKMNKFYLRILSIGCQEVANFVKLVQIGIAIEESTR